MMSSTGRSDTAKRGVAETSGSGLPSPAEPWAVGTRQRLLMISVAVFVTVQVLIVLLAFAYLTGTLAVLLSHQAVPPGVGCPTPGCSPPTPRMCERALPPPTGVSDSVNGAYRLIAEGSNTSFYSLFMSIWMVTARS